ncbi:uncharacterized protein LOC132282003 [Cornus florida]|uniref:uncharacterized protein LOC132282003 n=1 Tax=Cornus florida TaxID=4283 RepID=UPI00289E4A90|nr:uncharacterized protein LOC132282003 [Cornus florida]
MDFGGCYPTLWPKRWVDLTEKWNQFSCPTQCLSLASFICWTLWKCRNDLLFNHRRWDPFEASQKALTDFFEFQEIHRQSQLLSFLPSLSPTFQHPLKWSPPPMGFFKLNIDAAFNPARPSQTEGLVLRESLSLIHLWGYSNVIVEGDCQPVMKLKSSIESLYVVFADVSHLLSVCKGSSLAWAPRSVNGVAHLVSKSASLVESGDLEWSVWPKWLLDALSLDCNFAFSQ